MAFHTLEDVTYAAFGIDPASFYADKFSVGVSAGNMTEDPQYRFGHALYKNRLQYEAMASTLGDGAKVLDIGCGSGHNGPTFRNAVTDVCLVGVDLSPSCIKDALANGYDEAICANFLEGLPFEDGLFDAVTSLDVFGHVEFRDKDRLVSEIARVTRPGGVGHHGVETGFADYLGADPDDPDDPVRQYVWVDGHVGIETARRVMDRFAKHFRKVEWHPTYIFPIIHRDTLAAADVFGDGFADALSSLDGTDARRCADIILGRLNQHYIETLRDVLGRAFQPYDEPPEREHLYSEEAGPDAHLVSLAKVLLRPAGFSSITLKR